MTFDMVDCKSCYSHCLQYTLWCCPYKLNSIWSNNITTRFYRKPFSNRDPFACKHYLYLLEFSILTIRASKLIDCLFEQIMKFLSPFQSFLPRTIRTICTHLFDNTFPLGANPFRGLHKRKRQLQDSLIKGRSEDRYTTRSRCFQENNKSQLAMCAKDRN